MTDKLAIKWAQTKQQYPHLLPTLAQMALDLKAKGVEHYSIDALFHVMRFQSAMSTGDMGLKMNNNYSSFAARDLMEEHSSLAGFFRLRKQRPRGNWGQIS